MIARFVIGFRRRAVLGCLVLAHALLSVQEVQPPSRIPSSAATPTQDSATNSRVSVASTNLSGAALSRAYGQSCHLYPEPALIDRETWAKGTLPYMSVWLGVGKFELSRRADAQILKESHVFTKQPILK